MKRISKKQKQKQPKRSKTALSFFCREHRQVGIMSKDLFIAETTQLMHKWEDMNDEERQMYITQAINDKKRFENEMTLFVKQYASKNTIDLTGDISVTENMAVTGSTNIIENNDNEEKKNMEDFTECVICMDNPKQALMMPCLHVSSCMNCSVALDKCPICRENIDSIKKIYIS